MTEQEMEIIERQFSEIVDGGEDISDIKEKCVYAVKFENGFVKIGIAFRPKHRIESLNLPSGSKVLNYFISRTLPNPCEAENIIRETFKENHIDGCLYRINFDRAVLIIKKRIFPDKYDRNRKQRK